MKIVELYAGAMGSVLGEKVDRWGFPVAAWAKIASALVTVQCLDGTDFAQLGDSPLAIVLQDRTLKSDDPPGFYLTHWLPGMPATAS